MALFKKIHSFSFFLNLKSNDSFTMSVVRFSFQLHFFIMQSFNLKCGHLWQDLTVCAYAWTHSGTFLCEQLSSIHIQY